jgi:ribonuclease J
VLATFSALDVDRLVTLYKATQKAGRVFVADAYTAFVMHLVGNKAKLPKPSRENGIRVFYNHLFERRQIDKIRNLFLIDRIELAEILAEPQKFVRWCSAPRWLNLTSKVNCRNSCRCLYGYWKGYLTKPDWVELQKHIAQVHGDFIPAHTSGHAYVADIISFVNSVNARTVIPIHTFEPQMYQKHFPNVTVLKDGVPFELA